MPVEQVALQFAEAEILIRILPNFKISDVVKKDRIERFGEGGEMQEMSRCMAASMSGAWI